MTGRQLDYYPSEQRAYSMFGIEALARAPAAKAASPLRRLIRGETLMRRVTILQSVIDGGGIIARLLPRIPFRLPLVSCEAECRTRSHTPR